MCSHVGRLKVILRGNLILGDFNLYFLMLISQLSGVINNSFHERMDELHKVRVGCFQVLVLLPKQLKTGFTQIYKIDE